MHCGWDSGFFEFFLNLIAVIDKDRVLGKDAGPVGALGHDRHLAGQQFVVARADLQALLDLPIEAFELCQNDRALQGIHAPTNADARMHVAPLLPMDANLAHGRSQGVVVGEDRATVAVATERLAREEAGAADGREVAAFPALVVGTKALGSVLDHRQVVTCSDGVDFVHIRRLAVEADRHDGFGLRRDGGFDLACIDVAGIGLDIDEDRHGSEQDDDFGGGDEGEGGGDHLVARLDAERHEGDEQGFGTAGDGDAVAGAGVGFEAFFEFADFRPHDVLAVVEHLLDARVDGGLEGLILTLQINEGNVHAETGSG